MSPPLFLEMPRAFFRVLLAHCVWSVLHLAGAGRAGGANSSVCPSVPPRERLLLRNRRSIFPGAAQEAPCCPTLGVTERACEREAIGRLKLVPGDLSADFLRSTTIAVPPVQWRWFGGSVAHDTGEIQDGREREGEERVVKMHSHTHGPLGLGKRKRGPWR